MQSIALRNNILNNFPKGHKETYLRLKQGNDTLHTSLFYLRKEHSDSFYFWRQIRRLGITLVT